MSRHFSASVLLRTLKSPGSQLPEALAPSHGAVLLAFLGTGEGLGMGVSSPWGHCAL